MLPRNQRSGSVSQSKGNQDQFADDFLFQFYRRQSMAGSRSQSATLNRKQTSSAPLAFLKPTAMPKLRNLDQEDRATGTRARAASEAGAPEG